MIVIMLYDWLWIDWVFAVGLMFAYAVCVVVCICVNRRSTSQSIGWRAKFLFIQCLSFENCFSPDNQINISLLLPMQTFWRLWAQQCNFRPHSYSLLCKTSRFINSSFACLNHSFFHPFIVICLNSRRLLSGQYLLWFQYHETISKMSPVYEWVSASDCNSLRAH